MAWTNAQAYAMWKATLKGDEGNCADWLRQPANADDQGGLTHWGVTRDTWIGKARQYGWDTRWQAQCAMTDSQFDRIVRDYWTASNAPKIRYPGVAILAAQMYWGTGGAIPLQRALRKLGQNIDVDGVIGNNTLNAIHAVKVDRLMRAVEPEFYRWFTDLKYTRFDKNGKFQVGWADRVSRILALAYSAENNAAQVRYKNQMLTVPNHTQKTETSWVSVLFASAAVAGAGYLGYRYFKKRQGSGQ